MREEACNLLRCEKFVADEEAVSVWFSSRAHASGHVPWICFSARCSSNLEQLQKIAFLLWRKSESPRQNDWYRAAICSGTRDRITLGTFRTSPEESDRTFSPKGRSFKMCGLVINTRKCSSSRWRGDWSDVSLGAISCGTASLAFNVWRGFVRFDASFEVVVNMLLMALIFFSARNLLRCSDVFGATAILAMLRHITNAVVFYLFCQYKSSLPLLSMLFLFEQTAKLIVLTGRQHWAEGGGEGERLMGTKM